jgi:putative FmdB family regulatory protein
MALYVYKCQQCGTVFEVQATFKEKENGLTPECPQCQSIHARQQITSGLLLQRRDLGAAPSLPSCGPNAGPGCCGV